MGRIAVRSTVLAAAACALAGALAAQNPPAAPAAAAPQAPRPTAIEVAGGGTAQYLVDHPDVLQLTPVQVQRVRKVAAHVDSLNAPVRAQLQQVQAGRDIRTVTPLERRQMMTQMHPLFQQIRANNQASLDSILTILTPAQATQLESLREEFKERMEARRAAAPQVPARARPRRP